MRNTSTPLFFIGLLAIIFSLIGGAYCSPSDEGPAMTADSYQPQDQDYGQDFDGPTDEQIEETQRLLLWGCYFFTKKVLYLNQVEVSMLLAGHVHKDNLHKKIVADLMIDCVTGALPEDIRAMVQEEFDMNRFSHLHTYSIEKYEKMENLETLSDQDFDAFLYFEEIEDIIRQQSGETGDDYQQADVKIFGVSLESISSVMRVIFFASLAGMIVLTIYNKFAGEPQKTPAEQANKKEDKKGSPTKKTEEKTEKKEAKTEAKVEAKKETKKDK